MPAPTSPLHHPDQLDAQRRFLCRHIHTTGNRCGSPALRGQNFCYYHDRTRRDVPSSRIGTFAMPRVDDRAAIQLALFEVLARLASGDIDYKRGTSILYGLQIASANLRDPKPSARTFAQPEPVVEDIISDPWHGDLAPIAELPTPEPTLASKEDEDVVILERSSRTSGSPATPTPSVATTPQDAVTPEQAPKLEEAVILEQSSRTSVFAPAPIPPDDPEPRLQNLPAPALNLCAEATPHSSQPPEVPRPNSSTTDTLGPKYPPPHPQYGHTHPVISGRSIPFSCA